MRKVSAKKRAQLKEEKILTARLIIKQSGRCAECNNKLGWGAAKHEIVFRSRGGDPTKEENCVLLCLKCHSAKHGIKIVKEV